MSKAELEVVLAERGPFQPGQTIEGFVGVTANKDARCRGLTVSLQWFTHGRGGRSTTDAVTETLFEGPLVAGRRDLHPFSLTVPPGPFTYEGHLVNVGWQVQANADLPWAFDPRASEPVVVVEGDAIVERLAHGEIATGVHRVGKVMAGLGAFITAAVFTMVGGAFLVCFGLVFVGTAMRSPSAENLVGAAISIIVPSVFILVGLNGFRVVVARFLANRRVKRLELDVPARLHPGQRVPVAVTVESRSDLAVDAVVVDLVCSERAVIGSGTKRRTATHTVHHARTTIATPGTITRNGPMRYTGELVVPEDAGMTFSYRNTSVFWHARATIDCPGPLDPEYQVPVQMVPRSLATTR